MPVNHTKRSSAEFSKHFLAKKTLYGPKKDPVWVYLEREMLQNIDKKPYNQKVGDWLKFLKDLKRYFYLEVISKQQHKTCSKLSNDHAEMLDSRKHLGVHSNINPQAQNKPSYATGMRLNSVVTVASNSVTVKLLAKVKKLSQQKKKYTLVDQSAVIKKYKENMGGVGRSDENIGKRQVRILKKEGGPLWYVEMSGIQKEVLRNLGKDIHYDLIEDLPNRTRKSLSDLGISRSIPNRILLKAMNEACDDAAVFIWKLYTEIYTKTPSELRGEYDMDAMILMSALTFIDLEECVENLKELTKPAKETPEPNKKTEVKKTVKYKCRYGEYLEKSYVPVYCRHPSPQRGHGVKRPPPRMEKKITIRSDDSYERLRMDDTFLERRLQRSVKAKQAERICTYKFWEPPVYLRSTNKAMEDYYKKLRLLHKSAKPTHIRETDINNIKFHVGPVCLVGGRPRYLLNSISVLPTGYIAINSGTVVIPSGECLTVIAGAWKYPMEKEDTCDEICDCTRWESAVMKYLEESKCKCGHLYDYYLEGKSKEKYFYPPTKHWPMWFDKAKIFQLDPMEDFIKEAVRVAERSEEPTPAPSHPELSTSGITLKALLKSFLADLSGTALVIPHLPQAFLLNNLLEWARKRFKGDLPPTAHRNSLVKSMRRWLWLNHIDFRERAYMIPFTRKELAEITWADRQNLQTLFETLLRDFTTRNRLRQLEQTRLWWSTMKFDTYPSQAFLDVYFTYMPGRMKDTCVFNPFNSLLTPKDIYKTCPLS